MPLRRRTTGRVALVVLAVVLTGVLAGAGAGSPGAEGPAASPIAPGTPADVTAATTPDGAAAMQEVDADRTRVRIDLRPDGDGEWTLELWTRLQDDADRAAFQSLQDDVAANESAFAADFRERMSGSVQAASDETGRDMAVRNVSVSTRTEAVPSEYGVLVYEFEWTNFAAVDGAKLRAGDAIDGFLLTENTRLTISWPADYRQASVTPSPDDRTDEAVVWRGGETDFTIGEPRLVVTSADEKRSLLPLLGAGAVIVLVAAIVVWLGYTGRLPVPGQGEGTRRDGEAASGAETVDTAGGGDGAGSATEAGSTAAATTDGSQAGPEGSDTDDGTAAAGDGASDTGGHAKPDVPPDLLSNEEQVLRLLEEHGGRMKQQQVVAELDWTEAKTSQVVTSMDADDEIEKFRIGRENVLALPEEADL